MSRTFTRTPQACTLCRRRKTKCDGVRPRCSLCASRNLTCTWATTDAISTSLAPSPSPSRTSAPISAEEGPLDTVSNSGGSSTIRVSLPFSPSSTNTTGFANWPEISPGGFQLCLSLFFERHFASDFCSFDHRPDFEHKCRNDPLLSSAIVALCSRYLSKQDAQSLFGAESPSELCAAYTHRARVLAKEASDTATISHIQAHLILAMALLLSNSGSRHWLFAGTAIRMAEIMRLNKEFHHKHSLRDQEIRRRVFWACLLFDRLLAYLLAKHRTIGMGTVSIPVPSPDASLVWQDPTRGVTLHTLAEYPRPSDLGLTPYLVKTVCVWSDMADLAVYSRRQHDAFPPTDPRSAFFGCNAELQEWEGTLAGGVLPWSRRNFEGHCALGQAVPYVAIQFLLASASCVAHQCYLPHLPLYAKLVNLVDAAGVSYLDRDPGLIDKCVASALRAGEMLEVLMEDSSAREDGGNIRDDGLRAKVPRLLQTVWVAVSVLTVSYTFLWLQYAQDEMYSAPEIQERARSYTELALKLVSSWALEWKAARKWKLALKSMHQLYRAAYLGEEVGLDTLRQDGGDELAGDSDEGESSDGDFRPQPGDGYPQAISLPNLQSLVKFATCDTSAKAICLQSIWLQLSSGWPNAPFDLEGFPAGSIGDELLDPNIVVDERA